MLLDIDLVIPEDTALILYDHTGIYYVAQAGGVGCSHPRCEGFAINLGDFGQDFDDCGYACSAITFNPGIQEKLGKDLAEYLKARTQDWVYSITFDFERISLLEEGWWPVKIKGTIDQFYNVDVDTIGFIHVGNCD